MVQQQVRGQPRENGLAAVVDRSGQNCTADRHRQTEWEGVTSFPAVIANWEHWRVSTRERGRGKAASVLG